MPGVFPHDGPYTQFTLAKQLSTDRWTALDRALDVKNYKGKFLRLENTNQNSNSVDFRVKASLDYGDNYDVTLKAATTLTAGASNTVWMPEAVSHVKVEIKATSNGAQDEVKGKMGAHVPEGGQ